MNLCKTVFISAIALLFLASCAKSGKRMVVVLLPGPDGKTGQIVVSNEAGSLLISEPGHATEVRSPNEAPSKQFVMPKEKISDEFGTALAVLPAPPLHFTLYFHTGTTILTQESRKLLTELLPQIAARRTSEVSIVGHTDRVGTRKLNFQLGLDRAMEIKQLLVSQGIKPSIVEATSHGEDNPLVATEDDVPEPKNRRVEVILR
jgi:outer membrane protein OmpA-like peptidoglycan-associated protein